MYLCPDLEYWACKKWHYCMCMLYCICISTRVASVWTRIDWTRAIHSAWTVETL